MEEIGAIIRNRSSLKLHPDFEWWADEGDHPPVGNPASGGFFRCRTVNDLTDRGDLLFA